MEEKILEGLSIINVENKEEKAELLSLYLKELLLFNPTLSLVGEKDKNEIIRRHILDSAGAYNAFLLYSKEGGSVVDLGSGAGLPGIVLSIIIPNRTYYLVERMTRRALFLKGVVAALKLKNVVVLDTDAKNIDRKFDTLTCRAFQKASYVFPLCLSLLEKDGVSIFYKGKIETVNEDLKEIEKAGLSADVEKVTLSYPFIKEERKLLIAKSWRRI